MDYITVAREQFEGKVAHIKCVKDDDLKNIEIKDKRFLLIVLLSGSMTFSYKGSTVNATAPCFICFNETENPLLISKSRAEYHTIYFHPDFLNVNMSFDFIRAKGYGRVAINYDLFMLLPFIDGNVIVPISDSLIEKTDFSCRCLYDELDKQRDGYWSCRGRSYFMEIIICLERMYGLAGYSTNVNAEVSPTLDDKKLRDAVMFIEGHYMDDIDLDDISRAGNINHTTLTNLMKNEFGMTAIQYLWFYRVRVAKKQLEFTNIPIKDIVQRTGFKTVPHFSRIFTRQVGETPAQFRKNALQKRINGIGSL